MFVGPPRLPGGYGGRNSGWVFLAFFGVVIIGLFATGIFTHVQGGNGGHNVGGNLTGVTNLNTGSNHGATPWNLGQVLGPVIPLAIVFLMFGGREYRKRRRGGSY